MTDTGSRGSAGPTGPGAGSATPERVGLFGGSFDPVHCGHLLVARAAQEELGLSRVVFIPASQSPFKPDRVLAPAEARVRLLRLALAGRGGWEVDEAELRRGGVSYTIDTVRAQAEGRPGAELYWIVGADHLSSLARWREAEALAALTRFVVVPRPGETPMAVPPPFRVTWLRGFPVAISASAIRARVRAGLPLDWLVPATVAEAIGNYRLYF
jgi:nicotinate-nucleotide adenylyltransferase